MPINCLSMQHSQQPSDIIGFFVCFAISYLYTQFVRSTCMRCVCVCVCYQLSSATTTSALNEFFHTQVFYRSMPEYFSIFDKFLIIFFYSDMALLLTTVQHSTTTHLLIWSAQTTTEWRLQNTWNACTNAWIIWNWKKIRCVVRKNYAWPRYDAEQHWLMYTLVHMLYAVYSKQSPIQPTVSRHSLWANVCDAVRCGIIL